MADGDPILEVKGINGQVRLYDDHISISHGGVRGLLSQGQPGDKTILIRQISSVEYKEPGRLTNGYIQLAFLGGRDVGGGILGAGRDQNSVIFNGKQRTEFERLRDEVMRRIAAAPRGGFPGVGNGSYINRRRVGKARRAARRWGSLARRIRSAKAPPALQLLVVTCAVPSPAG